MLERLAAAEQRIAELEREVHRQAAPFRRPPEKRKQDKDKHRPGRPQGHPPAHRKPPRQVDEQAEVPLQRCSHCAGPVENVRPLTQVIEDIPVVVVRHLHLTTYRGECPHCGPVHSTHLD